MPQTSLNRCEVCNLGIVVVVFVVVVVVVVVMHSGNSGGEASLDTGLELCSSFSCLSL